MRPSGVAFNDEDQVLVINTCFNSCCSLLHDPRVEFTMPSLSQGELSFPARLFLISGAVSACISVLLSAALAHLPVFSAGMPAMVQTALTQQQFHALGLVGADGHAAELALRPPLLRQLAAERQQTQLP